MQNAFLPPIAPEAVQCYNQAAKAHFVRFPIKLQEVYDSYIQQWNEAGGTDWEAEVTQLWNEQQAAQ